jgi:hypothetical protein
MSSIDSTFDERESRRRVRSRWGFGGFCFGLVLAWILTAIEFAILGWRILPVQLVWNMIWIPCVTRLVALRYCSIKPESDSLSWKQIRLRTSTLMWLIAYFALLLGAVSSTIRYGSLASRYYSHAFVAEGMNRTFRELAFTAELDAKQRTQNACMLRQMKIPETLMKDQCDFLRSLDQQSPEIRRERYKAIEKIETAIATTQSNNVAIYRKMSDYYLALAKKYRNAQAHPWEWVEPDGPVP